MRSLLTLIELSGADVRRLAAGASVRRGGDGRVPAPERRPLEGAVVAVLPFAASGESPAAWIAAAQRLGAGVLRREDVLDASADAFAVCTEAARWADLLVVSHTCSGFARAVAAITGRPVVNAGEAGGEDPVAGISLLAAALPEHPDTSRRLRAAVCGDLWQSRSARAFLAALAAVEATILLVPARGRDLPEAGIRRLARRMGRNPRRFEAHAMKSLLDMVDTVLLAPEDSPQLPLFPELAVPPDEAARRARRDVEDLDVLFVAAGSAGRDRIVREPFRGRTARLPGGGAEHYVSAAAFESVLRWAAGDGGDRSPADAAAAADGAHAPTATQQQAERYTSALGLICHGERCVAARHADVVTPEFLVTDRDARRLECVHCGETAEWAFAASKVERRFHAAGTPDAAKILPANLVLFRTRAEALTAGFDPPRRRAKGIESAADAATDAATDPGAGDDEPRAGEDPTEGTDR